jgi:hypothetical protein
LSVVTVTLSSDGYHDINYLLLLGVPAAMGTVTSVARCY